MVDLVVGDLTGSATAKPPKTGGKRRKDGLSDSDEDDSDNDSTSKSRSDSDTNKSDSERERSVSESDPDSDQDSKSSSGSDKSSGSDSDNEGNTEGKRQAKPKHTMSKKKKWTASKHARSEEPRTGMMVSAPVPDEGAAASMGASADVKTDKKKKATASRRKHYTVSETGPKRKRETAAAPAASASTAKAGAGKTDEKSAAAKLPKYEPSDAEANAMADRLNQWNKKVEAKKTSYPQTYFTPNEWPLVMAAAPAVVAFGYWAETYLPDPTELRFYGHKAVEKLLNDSSTLRGMQCITDPFMRIVSKTACNMLRTPKDKWEGKRPEFMPGQLVTMSDTFNMIINWDEAARYLEKNAANPHVIEYRARLAAWVKAYKPVLLAFTEYGANAGKQSACFAILCACVNAIQAVVDKKYEDLDYLRQEVIGESLDLDSITVDLKSPVPIRMTEWVNEIHKEGDEDDDIEN